MGAGAGAVRVGIIGVDTVAAGGVVVIGAFLEASYNRYLEDGAR